MYYLGTLPRKQGVSKTRKSKFEEHKSHGDMDQTKTKEWKDDNIYQDEYQHNYTYPHLDFFNFEPIPVSSVVRI